MRSVSRDFLEVKIRSLAARARRLSRLTLREVGIRRMDLPYAPTRRHFQAANERLRSIDARVLGELSRLRSVLTAEDARPGRLLHHVALIERQVDRARRAYALFFDLFSQRGTRFAPALAACDAIAEDCFRAVARADGAVSSTLLGPLTYLEHGFSPATFRRGVVLARLLGESNPFPMVRVPYDQVESPWAHGVLLHELGHNLQSDLGIWRENRSALARRVLQATGDPWLTRIFARWHKEIFADLLALLLGGPATAVSMQEFLAHPPSRVLTFQPLGVHPTGYLRMFLMAEMLRRMGFGRDAARVRRIWRELYAPHLPLRIPPSLLQSAPHLVPHVVDEVAFQPRARLAQRALVDILKFRREDQERIEAGGRALEAGRFPDELPARFVVGASRVAFDRGRVPPGQLSALVLRHLSRRHQSGHVFERPTIALAA